MSKPKTSLYYMNLCRKVLEQISVTDKNDGATFARLKKKAQKYLNKAKDLEAMETKNKA